MKKLLLVASIVVIVGSISLPAFAFTLNNQTAPRLDDKQKVQYQQLKAKASNLSVNWDEQNIVPKWVRMTNLDIKWRNEDYSERAYQFLDEFGSLYKISDPKQELHLEKVKHDELGMTHVTLQQNYKGIPVYGGQLQFHFRANGSISSIGGNVIPNDPKIIADTALTSQQAQQIAENTLRNQFSITDEQFNKLEIQSTKPTLYFYNTAYFLNAKRTPI